MTMEWDTTAGRPVGAERAAARDLPLPLWAGLPILSVCTALLSPLLGWELWRKWIAYESGLWENATVVFLVVTVVLSGAVFLRRRALPRGFGWMMLALALGALYFAGEEASWGQHWLGFGTPGWAEATNR